MTSNPAITKTILVIMRHFKPLPPLEVLFEYFYLDETSPSGLRWRCRKGAAKPGSIAGSKKSAYWLLKLSGTFYYCHRIVFFMSHRKDPLNLQIDHKDRNKGNNKIDNLRLVTTSENARNTGNRSNNTSGVKGVYFHKPYGKYRATIRVNNRRIYLGNFARLEDAAAARKAAELKYWGRNY